MIINVIFRIVSIFGIVAVCYTANAQISNRAFGFIERPSITGLASLGGINVTSSADALMFLANPALLDSTSEKSLSVHYLNFPGDLRFATVGHSWTSGSRSRVAAGVQYADYGEFEGFDETGFPLGTFHANEFALTFAYVYESGVFRYGANFKLIGSVLEAYNAYAAAVDIGITYQRPTEDLKIGIVAKHIGGVFSTYLPDAPLRLPTDVWLGVSYKAENMPIRFHLTARNLVDSGDAQAGNVQLPNSTSLVDGVFRRVILGFELPLHESFEIRAGYNYLIRQEYADSTGSGLGGFSGGLVFRGQRFALSYAIAGYRVPGPAHLIGLQANLQNRRAF